MLVRTLVNKVLFVCKRSVENYFTPYLANKVLFAKVRSSVYKFIRCLAQIYTCCCLSSFGLTETAKYKLPYILYATCFAESVKRLRHKFRVAPRCTAHTSKTEELLLIARAWRSAWKDAYQQLTGRVVAGMACSTASSCSFVG